MKIDRFILSTDENPNYIFCWPLVSQVIKKIFACNISLAFITEKEEDHTLLQKMKRFGEVVVFKPIEKIPPGNQAKVSRMYLSTYYQDETCVINDVDLLPLQKDFLVETIKNIPDDCLVAIGGNAYKNSAENGKFPMVYTTGKGRTFKEIINPNDMDYVNTIGQWKGLRILDNKEAINNPHCEFSDESLLRALLTQWKNNRTIYLDRPDFVGMRATRRIDRTNWIVNKNMLISKWYIDAHLPRPLNVNMALVIPLAEYFGLSVRDITL